MLIWHFLYLILVVCLISIFFHDSYNWCLRDSNSFRNRLGAPAFLIVHQSLSSWNIGSSIPLLVISTEPIYCKLLLLVDNKASQAFFFDCIDSVSTGNCTNIQWLHYFTITGMWLFLEIGLYLWFQDGFKLFIHFFLVDSLSTGPKIIVFQIFIHYYMVFLSNNPFCVVLLGSPFTCISKNLKIFPSCRIDNDWFDWKSVKLRGNWNVILIICSVIDTTRYN